MQWTCEGWEARIDLGASGGPATLRVVGRCEFPKHGVLARLQPAGPGADPRDLRLRLVVTDPTEPVIQTPERVEVRYSREALPGQFDTVSVEGEGGRLGIPVETVA